MAQLQTIKNQEAARRLFDFVQGLPRQPAFQQTLERPTGWLAGPEPHTNARIKVRLYPAPPDTGIVFLPTVGGRKERPDQFSEPSWVKADLAQCTVQGFTVALSHGHWRVAHVEHLLACLYALGVDNAWVVVQKNLFFTDIFRELALPLFCSSTLPYLLALSRAGVAAQSARRCYRTVTESYILEDGKGGDVIEARRGEGLAITYTAGYPSLGIQDATFSLSLSPYSYTEEISEARTMVNRLNRWHYNIWRLLGSVYFITYGFGIGVNQENAITSIRGEILSRRRYGGERSELVRHKIMDFLAAARFLGPLSGVNFAVVRSGHRHDLAFCRELEKRLAPGHVS